MKHYDTLPARRCLLAVAILCSCLTNAVRSGEEPAPGTALPSIDRATWIWGAPASDVCEFRIAFKLDQPPEAASVLITADNGYELYVNSGLVGFDVGADSSIWNSLERWDITSRLAQGRNVIGIRGICLGGSRGVIAALRVEMAGGKVLEIVTDPTWRVTSEGKPETYSHPEFLETEGWENASALGPMGMAPWNHLTYAGSTGGRRLGMLPGSVSVSDPEPDFVWPEAVAFVADDCSVYVPVRGDAWGVCFRVDNWSRAYTEFDLPCPIKIGRKLCVLEPAPSGATPRVLVDAGRGVLGSPSTSYDGQSILLTMAAEGDSFFHIYRVPIDGQTPQQLTYGPFHDIDPAELPDGRIVFTSTRIGTFEEYHNPPSRALFVMQPDGNEIQPITHTPIFDNEPKVTADGRIAFVRTDNFFDRAKVETQIHVIRPDGTNGMTEIGSDVGADYGTRLRALGYGSPAPLPDGRMACISSRGNFVCTPGGSEASFQRLPSGLGDLAPLPDGRLLATVLRPHITSMWSDVLAVLDPRDNRLVRVYESPDGSIHSPVFLGPRHRPPVIPSHVREAYPGEPGATGFLYCRDVRFTRKTKADWNRIRMIRVLAAKGLTTRSSHSHIVHAGHETVELGTVPIAADGSFAVEVPADTPLALQAVDAEGRSELNEMSWIYVRPGEARSCVGCHHERNATPPLVDAGVSDAIRGRPLKLLGQGSPHHFRGNNSGVTGMMDLQFERFRETASLNQYRDGGALAPGREEVARLGEELLVGDEATRISAANRLALFRDRSAAPELAKALTDPSREVRVAATLAISACGTRDSVAPLLERLEDADPMVVQAAAVALENLTAHDEPLNPFAKPVQRRRQIGRWVTWYREHPWPKLEDDLIRDMVSDDRVTQRQAIVALGHIGSDAARRALRDYVARESNGNPYPEFVNDNRTDSFTFPADSPLNPRTLQEATRALGYLNDVEAVPLLREILARHTDPRTGNLYLAESALEALGRIGTQEAEAALIDVCAKLGDYVNYVGWYSDHPALYACHASPLHARAIAALDWIGSTRTAAIVPHVIRSVPTDPDRALYLYSDTYELLVGRLIRRSGRGEELIATCLALLGDPAAAPCEELKTAVSTTFAAWAGTPSPENRAAQMLSAVCRDPAYEPQVRAAYERFRAMPEDAISRPLGNPSWIPQRHWVLFFLGRTLGSLGDPASLDTLCASLDPALNEARHGRPDPSEPNIHFLQLEYTPCWRASAAWALGRIGDRRAVPALLEVVRNLDNATDTRHAAAEALGAIGDPESLPAIRELAANYPEVSTRRALLKAGAPKDIPSSNISFREDPTTREPVLTHSPER
ncbi:MAG: HEAT repeat domain-containing protein [Pirellulaceae bacterium]